MTIQFLGNKVLCVPRTSFLIYLHDASTVAWMIRHLDDCCLDFSILKTDT